MRNQRVFSLLWHTLGIGVPHQKKGQSVAWAWWSLFRCDKWVGFSSKISLK